MSLFLLVCSEPTGAVSMAVHKFNFAQIPLRSLKKLLRKNGTFVQKPLPAPRSARTAATLTRSGSKA